MLEIRALEAGYGSVRVLHGVDLDVGKGEIVALLGSNGAGKSTTFKCMSIEEIISDGRIRIGGQNIAQLYKNPSLLRNMIGYCPQVNVIRELMTVKETIEYLARLKAMTVAATSVPSSAAKPAASSHSEPANAPNVLIEIDEHRILSSISSFKSAWRWT